MPQKIAKGFIALLIAFGFAVGLRMMVRGGVQRVRYSNMTFEVLTDRMFRFEWGGQLDADMTDMVAPQAYPGPAWFSKTVDGFATPFFRVTVDIKNSCFKVFDLSKNVFLADMCSPKAPVQTLQISSPEVTNLYGLGEQFVPAGGSNLNWLGRSRVAGDENGNHMVPFEGGNTGNAQFPILYALGQGSLGYAVFLDNTQKQTWDFTKSPMSPWTVALSGGRERGYFFTGQDLASLRSQYMNLVGRPLVPPRKSFGLWVSQYGFRNWGEIEDKLSTLRANHFPIDGFVMDLQWFGGIKEGSEESAMGGLQWDEKNFPDPAAHIADFKRRGIGLITIEEPYISAQVEDRSSHESVFSTLEKKGYLAMANGAPARMDPKGWWGSGGMLDFINAKAADFWHDWKRQPLIEAGIIGHWTDLGEPEMYQADARYDDGKMKHADVQNIYNLRWSKSIYDGYQRNHDQQRPWILSRSGIPGSQRYGVSMWSGDIGSNFESLTAHMKARAQMSLSGIDFFGSDVGGFLRQALHGNLDRLYTSWFATSSLFDFPLRPHTENLCNCKQTAPDRIGDRAANLAAVRRRYEMIPYYYTLAHLAHDEGTPVVAPMVYYFQDDPNARDLFAQKMIGPSLMGAAVTEEGATDVNVYLPKGTWYDTQTGEELASRGEWRKFPVVQNGTFELPLLARAGAIIPEDELDDQSKVDGSLMVSVYPSTESSRFELIEDDGATVAYLKGAVRRTSLSQEAGETQDLITVGKAQGSYAGAPETRPLVLKIASNRPVEEVLLNGEKLDSWKQSGQELELRVKDSSVHQEKKIQVLFKRD